METIIRSARDEDAKMLIAFLQKARLGTEGVEESIEYFLFLEDDKGGIHATLGIEPLGRVGLLRSLVITERATEKDVLMIFEQMLKLSKEKQLYKLYLATNKETSLPFFSMLGFEREDKECLPEELLVSPHMKHILNVDNSLFLALTIG